MRRLLVAVALTGAAATACGSSSTGGSAGTPSAPPTSALSTAAAPTSAAATVSAPAGQVACDWQPSSTDTGTKKPGLPPATVPDTGTATVTMVTNRGTVVFTMNKAKTPCTAASFIWLASKRYFDDTPCPRVTDPGQGFSILQCGDPAGDGRGGPGYTIPDEALTNATYPKGTVAMANTGAAHSGGSQFFLCYEDTQLGPTYTPFGTITSGLDVLLAIGKKGNDGSSGAGGGKPAEAVTITSFTVA